jgi:dTDP-3-amino-3,4,6-trideoxy-alpha-D-glucose transaminase
MKAQVGAGALSPNGRIAGRGQEASRPRVPFADLARTHAPLAHELRLAFERVLSASSFILGEEVERFEAEFAAFCGARHCVGVASGTAALELALAAAGVGAGDQVILPAHTFIATALAVLQVGAEPVLVDVEAESGLLDPRAAGAAVGPRTAAIIAVHLYGQACAMGPLRELAARHGLLLLEDAAQAHGATHQGARAGSLAHAAAFSFYPSKNLGALGDAGAICSDDGELARAARRLRDLGRDGDARHAVAGRNERLDGLQAALLRVKLPHLEAWNAARRDLAARYRTLLGAHAELLGESTDSPCIYHLFPIRVERREALAAHLRAEGVATGVHYPLALVDQPPLQRFSSDAPRARDWAARELSLPIFPGMQGAELEAVAKVASNYLR